MTPSFLLPHSSRNRPERKYTFDGSASIALTSVSTRTSTDERRHLLIFNSKHGKIGEIVKHIGHRAIYVSIGVGTRSPVSSCGPTHTFLSVLYLPTSK